MIRHDEKYLKLIHDHLQPEVFYNVKKLPFFYFVIPDKWKINKHTIDMKILREVVSGVENDWLNHMPFPNFSFVIDQDPCLHVIDATQYEKAIFMVDYFQPDDYPSKVPDDWYDAKDIKRGLWAHYNVAAADSDREHTYGCVVCQHYRKKTIKNMELQATSAGPEIGHIYNSNLRDMQLVTLTLLAIFKTAEDKRLVKVTTPKSKNKSTSHSQAKQHKTSRFVADHHYVYLDGPPAHVMSKEQREATGRTVRGHARRAHWHKLTHPRYKNHPSYGGRIRIKATWVGPTEWVDEGKIYALHDPEDL